MPRGLSLVYISDFVLRFRSLFVYIGSEKPTRNGRLSTVDLLVLASLDQLLFCVELFMFLQNKLL
jgi:hypothetical protein